MAPADDASSTIEYSLLGLLNERPMYGYELARRLRNPTGLGVVWHVSQSNLYGMLAKLGSRGLVTVALEDQPTRPTRKVFRLSEAGESEFSRWMQSPVRHGRNIRIEFIAKLYFAERLNPVAARTLVREQKRACTLWYEETTARRDSSPDPTEFDVLVYEFRAGQLSAIIAWLERCEAFLDKRSEVITAAIKPVVHRKED
ncbi:MAG TPA: PadR family transcriptional regulator [Spirochaetia bacterium]|nr:PadR family transcriptional regulator [Spirochaetia bacterium]